LGSNYMQACDSSAALGDTLAGAAVSGLSDVLNGRTDSFYHEYPCHSPTEQRWFMMRVVPLRGHAERLFVVSHINITRRKLVEVQVESMSLLDPLTGLANRRHFDRFLVDEWSRAMRTGTPVSLLLVDIDHFKAYNDQLGHSAGDDCLCRVGKVLSTFSRRPTDLAVRWGGEEFALILGNTGLNGARKEAEAVRAAVAGMHLSFDGAHQVSVSVGVACSFPDLGRTEAQLVDMADKALYRAKHAGRNRVECA
jgi:diguanylate cyclase (GGDEF)-like protein